MRRWLLMAVALCVASPLAAAPPADRVAILVKQLTSDKHTVREAAVIALAEAGPDAVSALVTASLSPDPELAWRSFEALQIVGRTLDRSAAADVGGELTRLSRSTNKAEAAVAQRLLRQWPALRHDYAAGQLERLGAEIGDISTDQILQAQPVAPGGPMPPGGATLGGLIPMLKEPAVAEAVEVLEAVEAEEAAEAVAEVAEDEAPAAPAPAGVPLFGKIFKAIGRVAGDVKAADDALGEAVVEVVEERMEAEVERLEGGVGKADVEFIDEPPAPGEAAIEVHALGMGFMIGGRADVVTWGSTYPAVPVEADEMQPGTLRIGKGWRGGDSGLEYIAELQQFHTVILRDAPVSDAALAQLRKLRSLTQLRIYNTKLSSAALLAFRQQRPEVQISAWGPAMLGVAGSDHPHGMLVQQVSAENAARRAGLMEQDIIAKVDRQRVRGYGDLTLALYDKQPGDKIQVEYIRAGKRATVEATLTPRGDESLAASPPPQLPSYNGPSLMRAFRGGFVPAGGMGRMEVFIDP